MSGSSKRIIIVGAGVAGLTLGYLLSRDGHAVVVVERESCVGGLARSFAYDGYTFDIGPHRFHTDDPEVSAFIREILDGDFRSIKRKSGVWMFNRYFDWPLSLSSLFGMPLPVLFSVGVDFLGRRQRPGRSFEDYIIGKYGKTLYRIFFKPYTEKFIKMPCSEISRDWAVTGIDRAVIDRKIQIDSLSRLAKSVLFRRPPLSFLYPKSGGIQVFPEKLKSGIVRNGGSVLLNSAIERLEIHAGAVRGAIVGGQRYACDLLVWTGSVADVLKLLGRERIMLKYLSLLLYNYRITHPPSIDYQWCYYGSEALPFNRISIPALFNPALAPEGRAGLCVEVTCMQGDGAWNSPEAMEPALTKALAKVGVIGGEHEVSGLAIEKIPNAYPIYALDYREKRDKLVEAVSSFRNINLLGRTGGFWYNNMDHSIRAAIELFQSLR